VSRPPYGEDVPSPTELFDQLDVTGAPRAIIALGGTLEPEMLVAAYRAGCFPWPSGEEEQLERAARRLVKRGELPQWPGEDPTVPWCSPDPRAVLLADRIVVSRSLRRTLRRAGWETTVDAAFDEVVAGCAAPAPGREDTWITKRMRAAYNGLHEQGGAHSVEVWDGDELIGGLYGVLTGQVFSGESMFHCVADASKVAVVDLCARLLEAGVLVIDTQQPTEHLASMGQLLIHRDEYLSALAVLRDRPAQLDTARLPVSRLA
jgi:leucyl/phenylalanyl-tRNA--protein transferase